MTHTVPRPGAIQERPTAAPQPPRRSLVRWFADHIVLIVGILVLVYTFVPIAYIFALSFNQPSARSATAQLEGFTLSNWTSICEPDGLCESLQLSILVSITATILATVLGTLMAFALVRHSFRGRSASNLVIFLPMATPEVVMGSSLLAMFVSGVAIGRKIRRLDVERPRKLCRTSANAISVPSRVARIVAVMLTRTLICSDSQRPSGSQIEVQLLHVKPSNWAVAERADGWLKDSAKM